MSLLMDALKKAELAKHQGQSNAVGASAAKQGRGELSLEPLSDSTPAAGAAATSANLPHLASHLDDLDAQFLAQAQQEVVAREKAQAVTAQVPEPTVAKAAEPPPAMAAMPPRKTVTPAPRPLPERNAQPNKAAAQNLFAAKQIGKPPAQKNFAVAVGIFTALSVAGIGGYFWWQLQPKSTLLARVPPPPVATPVAPPVAVSPAPTLAAPSAPTVLAGTIATRPATPRTEDDDIAVPAPVTARTPAAPGHVADPTALTEGDARSVRITKAPLQVDPALVRGFDAFNRGELAMAQLEYERARKSDPRNSDALHGLAAIAVRQGRYDQADLLYRQIVEADPQDAVAMAALINSRGQIDPNAAESRLKNLAAAQPELAAPHFSLGNLYARHGRWSEAQQSYFRAYSAEPDNPDILYNLAISLEHLRQNKLAAQYYSQAIAAAQNRPAGFDKAQASARLRTLLP